MVISFLFYFLFYCIYFICIVSNSFSFTLSCLSLLCLWIVLFIFVSAKATFSFSFARFGQNIPLKNEVYMNRFLLGIYLKGTHQDPKLTSKGNEGRRSVWIDTEERANKLFKN